MDNGGSRCDYTYNDRRELIAETQTLAGQPARTVTYGANGNTYVWDSENRLLSVTPNLPATGDEALVYSYDGQGRRVTRSILSWNGSWTTSEIVRFSTKPLDDEVSGSPLYYYGVG